MARHILAFPPHIWAILGFLVAQSLQSGKAPIIPTGNCRWSPIFPQLPLERAVCPREVVDDKRSDNPESWAPWTYKPYCLQGEYSPETTYCVFTDAAFRGGQGISIITVPEDAAGVAKALEEPYYSWERGPQSADPTLIEQLESSLWEVKDVPEKGKGVVARRDIKPGEVIMVDYPIVAASMPFTGDVSLDQGNQLLHLAISQLPKPSLFHDLSHSTGDRVIEDTIKTNNFGININLNPHMGLFPKISRINHACIPLASIRYSPRTLALEVVAYLPIPKGEEITLSYTPIGQESKNRLPSLRRWGFECKCSLCASEAKTAASDKRRFRMEIVLDALDAVYGDVQKVADLSAELFHLTEMERLTPKVGDYYETVALAYARQGEWNASKKYAQMALDYWKTFDGVDQERVDPVREWLAGLEKKLNQTRSSR